MLIGARFIQGVGGAMTSAVILGMIVTMFPEPRGAGESDRRLRLRRLGRRLDRPARSAASLTEAISWHWIFFINLPIGIAHRAAARCAGRGPRRASASAKAPTSPAPRCSPRALMIGVYAILGVTEHGWGAPQTLILSAVSLAADRRLHRPPGDGSRTR